MRCSNCVDVVTTMMADRCGCGEEKNSAYKYCEKCSRKLGACELCGKNLDMTKKQKVLFICFGNACRSPMAEKLCNSYSEGMVIADSAGVHPALPNILVDSETIEVMREVGIDISFHEPKHVDRVDISSFDALVNMSPFSASEILKLYCPDFKGKIIEWKVTDPRGASKDVYRSVRDCLKEKVLELIQELNGV